MDAWGDHFYTLRVKTRVQLSPLLVYYTLWAELTPGILQCTRYFQQEQHESKQQSLHYCCYHFQTAIFQAKTNLETLVYDVRAWKCAGTWVCFHAKFCQAAHTFS